MTGAATMDVSSLMISLWAIASFSTCACQTAKGTRCYCTTRPRPSVLDLRCYNALPAERCSGSDYEHVLANDHCRSWSDRTRYSPDRAVYDCHGLANHRP